MGDPAARLSGKRILRKIVSGNAMREMQIRKRRGAKTLWTRDPEALETCTNLAYL
jgi:hypothetical protein